MKIYASYLCKSKEEFLLLVRYMKNACKFKAITHKFDYNEFPGLHVIVQGNNYETLFFNIPSYSIALNKQIYRDDTKIFNELVDFLNFLDKYSKNK